MRLQALFSTALFAAAACISSAGAQVIYQPVQYQYRGPNNAPVFYYGGQDPFVFRQATAVSVDPGWGRVNGVAFSSSTRSVRESRSPVFSDAVPGVDLSGVGLSAKDAANFANKSVPTYFRKSDLMKSAVALPDGSRVVPAVFPVATAAPASPLPKGVVIIIPYKKPDAIPASIPSQN